ncbi:hypothetical protein [Actinokineospora pegani]|uniref:hypothetical protein n=1 Tax=Actinokineospora pegani TaxID=2654637 RepID=UPI0012EAAAFF|nr:hypothetical protein [Actinokineospora pegani]
MPFPDARCRWSTRVACCSPPPHPGRGATSGPATADTTAPSTPPPHSPDAVSTSIPDRTRIQTGFKHKAHLNKLTAVGIPVVRTDAAVVLVGEG